MYLISRRNFIIALALLAVPLGASAQQAISIGVPSAPVEYTVVPEIPGPSTPVTITVEGVGGFIGNSQVTWAVNGNVALQGMGANTFHFSTGALGHKTTVSVRINSTDHGTITNTWVFNPSLITLVWEAQTTVPPLYAGHALYSVGSRITVFAFPEIMQNGSRLPDSKLSFQWNTGDQAEPDQSGLGRSSFTFLGNQLNTSETVSVDVLSGATALGHAEVTIPSVDPQIVFYPRDPLRGILYNTALGGTYTLPGQEATLHAEPYYFSGTSAPGSQLAWSWTLNNNPTTGPNAGVGELTLRTNGGQKGTAIVGASIQNIGPTTFLQAAQQSVSLIFGGQQTSSVFGL